MHEAGVAERILEVVVERAARAGAARVTDVYLEMGEESGIDAEAVELHWPLLNRATPAEGARLHLQPCAEPRAFRLTAIEVDAGA